VLIETSKPIPTRSQPTRPNLPYPRREPWVGNGWKWDSLGNIITSA